MNAKQIVHLTQHMKIGDFIYDKDAAIIGILLANQQVQPPNHAVQFSMKWRMVVLGGFLGMLYILRDLV